MANVVRVIKNSNYTTLSNYHFKDRRLSWKAKGLLSTMLSLPDNWNYTIEGLATLAGDGIKSTNSGLAELEKNGYLTRKQLRDENGHFAMTEYTIFEEPVVEVTKETNASDGKEDIMQLKEEKDVPLCQNGQTADNTAFQPLCPKRQTEKRFAEKGVLLNTKESNTKELNINNKSSSAIINQEAEEEDKKLRERLEISLLARAYPVLAEKVFEQVKSRDQKEQDRVDAKMIETICKAIAWRQNKEPIRMLSNFINKCIDNILCGIDGCVQNKAVTDRNQFNVFPQRKYDFEGLEEELLANNKSG